MIKRFTIQVVLRILFIALSSYLIAHFSLKEFWFTALAILLLMITQIVTLINYVNQTNYSLSKFLNALKTEDYSIYFTASGRGDSFAKVYNDFNKIIGIFKQNKIEKEAQFKNFKQILEYVNLGIISIRKDDLFTDKSSNEIEFLNRAACDILNQPRHKYWHRLSRNLPIFSNEIKKISNGGKILMELANDEEQKQLSLEVLDVKFLDIPYLIITFQDIRSEIEQKEIEAWHNVIRVLAHEMLNSFTPVSSLASTIKEITEDETGKLRDITKFDSENLSDINLAASTIKKRSEGLLEFVNDYRAITNIPIPKLDTVQIIELFTHIQKLMQADLNKKNIQFIIEKAPLRATLNADFKLIEQVLINLISNSIHALENTKNPTIWLNFQISEYKITLLVSDNGKGIEKEILKNIFIPFYTTRKNGSGIGLSLSKNIMKKHNGKLLVQSEPEVKTTFSMVFFND